MDALLNNEYEVHIGLDWADSHHELCVALKGEKECRRMKLSADAMRMHECLTSLHIESGRGRIAVCFEQTGGSVVNALMMHDFIDLYPVNPIQVKNYRESFSPSGAKDDPADAQIMLELLCRHGDKLKCWKPDNEEARKLRLLCEARRRFVDERADWVNELRATLKLYYPQALTVANDNLCSEMFCAFLMKWPQFESFRDAPNQTVRRFLYGHNIRSKSRVEKIMKEKDESVVLTDDEAVVEPCILRIQALVRGIREHNKTVEAYNRKIRTLEAVMQDASLFQSLPGAGRCLAPRLLAAFGTDRSRFESAEDVNTYMGVAPVVERSGKKCWVHWRWSCPSFLRQTMVEFARTSIGQSRWAYAFYQDARQRKGKDHQAALRALAFKWVRIIYRCWQDRTPYNEEQYIRALKRKQSPLAKAL